MWFRLNSSAASNEGRVSPEVVNGVVVEQVGPFGADAVMLPREWCAAADRDSSPSEEETVFRFARLLFRESFHEGTYPRYCFTGSVKDSYSS